MQRRIQFELLLDDRHQHVHADGDPDLRSHGVLRGAVKTFDSQMLLDPFEEQLDLPSAFVQRADCQRRQRELIGQEHQYFACLGVAEADAPKVGGVTFGGVVAVERDGLVADQSGAAIHWRRVHTASSEVSLGARDKEGSGLIRHVQPSDNQIAPIHHIELNLSAMKAAVELI